MTRLCNFCSPPLTCMMIKNCETCKRHQLLTILDRVPEFDLKSTEGMLIFHLARKIKAYAFDNKVELSQKELNVVNKVIKTWEGF